MLQWLKHCYSSESAVTNALYTGTPVCSPITDLLPSHSVNSHRSDSAVAKGIIGTCLITTDCASSLLRSDAVPQLPVELRDLITDFVLDDMKRSHDGIAVANLLHTSSAIRSKVSQAFLPIELVELPAQPGAADRFGVRRVLHDYIWDSLGLFLFTDTFTRRAPTSLDSLFEKHSDHVLTTIRREENGTQLDCQVRLRLEELRRGGRLLHPEITVDGVWIDEMESVAGSEYASVATAAHMLKNALRVLGTRLGEEAAELRHSPTLAPPCFNLYQRALSGYLHAVLSYVTFDVQMTLHVLHGDNPGSVINTWQFRSTMG